MLPTERLASYLPQVVLDGCRERGAAPAQPLLNTVLGAVLFADISGFTALSEALSARGDQGLEDLNDILTRSFTLITDTIAAHGGDVIKFAGDGLVALWSAGSADGLSDATLRAVQCAWALQDHLADKNLWEGISLRIGVGAGNVQLAHVGGVDRHWHLLLSGLPLVQVRVARLVEPGEVALSTEAWDLVRDRCTGEPLRVPANYSGVAVRLGTIHNRMPPRRLDRPPVPDRLLAALRSYVPPALVSRLEATHTHWLAEIRRVSAVFLHLPGLVEFGGGRLAQVQEVVSAVQRLVHACEATLLNLSVDEKGVYVIIVFGWPIAHEEDAAQSVLVALKIRQALRSLDAGSAIGVATGDALCGTIGGQGRRDYAVGGELMAIAARLMFAAAENVLCDEATYLDARHRIAFEHIPAGQVKGRAKAVLMYRPLKPVAPPVADESALAGRSKEMSFLQGHLESWRAGDKAGAVVVVEGEAGIGKSRLVQEFVKVARRSGVRVLVGQADEMEKSTAYYAWRAVLEGLVRLRDVERSQLRDLIAGMLGEEERSAQLLPLLNEILPLGAPESELTAKMTPQQRAENTRTTLLDLLSRAAAGPPTLLVLEDAHWLDSASVSLVLGVIQRIRSILIVIVTRPRGEPESLLHAGLKGTGGIHRLWIEPLPRAEIGEIVAASLGARAIPGVMLGLIWKKAQGNPLYSEQIAYALRDLKKIEIDDGLCSVRPGVEDLEAIDLPHTLKNLVLQRFDRLPDEPKLTARVASVLSGDWSIHVLREIHPLRLDDARLGEDLARLEAAGLVIRSSRGGDVAYAFGHSLIQEAIYDGLPANRRLELHHAAAKLYERMRQEGVMSFFPQLAHHWSRANVRAEALFYLERAGEQALRAGAYEEACRFFRDTIEWGNRVLPGQASTSNEAAARLREAWWHQRLGEAHYGLAQLRLCQIHCERALSLYEGGRQAGGMRYWKKLPVELMRQLLRRLLAFLHRKERVAQERPAGEEDIHPTALAEALCHERLAQVYYLDNQKLALFYSVLAGVNRSEAYGTSAELARGYSNMCVSLGASGLHGIAEAYERRAWRVAAAVGRKDTEAYVATITALYCVGVGRFDDAEQRLEAARSYATDLQDLRRWEESTSILGVVKCRQGQFAASRSLFKELYRSAFERGVTQSQAWALCGLVESGAPTDESGGEIDLLERLLREGMADLGASDQLWALGALSQAYLARGEVVKSLDLAERTTAILARSPITAHYTLPAYVGSTECYLRYCEQARAKDREKWFTMARRACKALRAFSNSFVVARPAAWRCLGLYQCMAGKARGSQAAWERSIEQARRLRMEHELGLAYYEMGTRGMKEGREHALAEARRIFNSLRASRDLLRLEAPRAP